MKNQLIYGEEKKMYEMNLKTMCGISLIYLKVFMENNGKMVKCEVQNKEINLQFSQLRGNRS